MDAKEIVDQMMATDTFSQWLGVEILEVKPGYCEMKCTVREDMLNGHQMAHGGITYSLSDSALAFAANGHGNRCVSIETSISHLRPVKAGDELNIVCNEVHRGKTIATYATSIENQDGTIVSRFKGTVHISREVW